MSASSLPKVAFDVHRTMEDAQDLDSILGLDEIRDAVVTVHDFTDFTIGDWLVTLTEARMFLQNLDLLVDALHHFVGRFLATGRDVFVNLLQRLSRFLSPDYFCHASIFSPMF